MLYILVDWSPYPNSIDILLRNIASFPCRKRLQGASEFKKNEITEFQSSTTNDRLMEIIIESQNNNNNILRSATL